MAKIRRVKISRQETIETEIEIELPAYFKWTTIEDHFTSECWVRITTDGQSLSVTRTRHFNRPGGPKIDWEFSLSGGHLGDQLSYRINSVGTRTSSEDEFSRAVATALHEISEALSTSAGASYKRGK